MDHITSAGGPYSVGESNTGISSYADSGLPLVGGVSWQLVDLDLLRPPSRILT